MTKACPSSRCLPVTWRASVVSDMPLIRRVEGPWEMCCICERFITVWGYYRGYHVTCPTLVPRLRDLRQICCISCHHNIHNRLQTWRQINEMMTKIEYCQFLSIASGNCTSFDGFTWRTRTNCHRVQGVDTIMETSCEKSVVQSEVLDSLHCENYNGSLCVCVKNTQFCTYKGYLVVPLERPLSHQDIVVYSLHQRLACHN